MIQFFARVVELREEKSVKCDGKITMDFPSREFLEVTYNAEQVYFGRGGACVPVMIGRSKPLPYKAFGEACATSIS